MRTSRDRILTTHVGSLPRSAALVEVLLKKDRGEAQDDAEYASRISAAVAEVLARQAKIGIDIPSDGEQSKVSYSTYMMDRLHGFGGDVPRKPALDLKDYPDFRARLAKMTGEQQFRRASCIGPVSVKSWEPLKIDIANELAAMKKAGYSEAFMNTASPGLISAFQLNKYYKTHEEYVWALADVMREECELIAKSGLLLQLDCPDLAMAHHTGFQDLSEADFLKRAELHVEAMNHALANVPAEQCRMHICWGNYEGPHDHDIALEKIAPIFLKAKPQAILFEASNPRHDHEWRIWSELKIPGDKILVPGTITSTSNYVEHPEFVAQHIERFAAIVGKERVIAGTDCGFGTFAGIGKMDPEISYKKLASLVEGAALASRRLWR